MKGDKHFCVKNLASRSERAFETRDLERLEKSKRFWKSFYTFRPVVFTILVAAFVAMMTFPDGLGKFFAGHVNSFAKDENNATY